LRTPSLEVRRSRRKLFGLFGGTKGEEGATLVEMALVTAFVYLPMLFFIFEISYAIYAYNFVSLMSREATRYASVRGSYSCIVLSTFPNCNLTPATAGNLQSWVQSQAFTGLNAGNITVNTSWWSASVAPGASGYSTTTWNTQCTGAPSPPCNVPTNAVQVTVTYAFPLNIPFWQQKTLSLSSTSRMVINL